MKREKTLWMAGGILLIILSACCTFFCLNSILLEQTGLILKILNLVFFFAGTWVFLTRMGFEKIMPGLLILYGVWVMSFLGLAMIYY